MPPSDDLDRLAEAQRDRLRRRVVHAAGLRLRSVSSVACADAGRGERERPARRRAAPSASEARGIDVTRAAPVAVAGRLSSHTTTSPTKSSDVLRLAESAAVFPEATSSSDDPTRHATSAATTGSRPGMRDGFHAAKRNPTPSATSNEPMWRAVCTGRPASVPSTSAGTATAICTSAIDARIQRSARLRVELDGGAAIRRRSRRGCRA